MNKTFFVLLVSLVATSSQAQEHRLVCQGNTCSMTAIDDDLNRLHLLGNDFEREVAEKLQGDKFLQVANPTVSLKSWRSEGTGYFQLTYSVTLRPSDSKSAVRHFARLGTVRSGSTLPDAKRAVASDNAPKIARLKNLYGTQPICSQGSTINARVFWYIEDCFAVGR